MKNYELRITNYKLFFVKILCVLCVLCGANLFAKAQSTNQNFPTAVTTNEISGTIKARDLGDARLTSYFYTFNGNQGDVFINVVTKNLDGDIDIFTADNLRPLTKITVYSDNPDSETGRVVYLRQPQKLILRVEGRTPTDDAATFRIKFAGSFAPAEAVAESDESKQPEVKRNDEGDIRVNSVGTIIEVKPKPTPKKTVAVTEEPKKPDEKNPDETVEKIDEKIAQKDETESKKSDETDTKPEVLITENLPKSDKAETDGKVAEKKTPKPKTVKPKKPKEAVKTETKPEKEKKPQPVESAQLENIRLIVEFKDGTKIERPMSEILKVGVDKGILTVIAKDGTIGRYSILDVAKMTIE